MKGIVAFTLLGLDALPFVYQHPTLSRNLHYAPQDSQLFGQVRTNGRLLCFFREALPLISAHPKLAIQLVFMQHRHL